MSDRLFMCSQFEVSVQLRGAKKFPGSIGHWGGSEPAGEETKNEYRTGSRNV